MSAELGDTRVHRSTRRRRTAAWVALVLALVLGGLVVRTVTDRRSPLGSRPLLVRTLDHPLIMLGSQPQNRFDPPQAAERARVPAATVFRAWLRQTRHSYYDRAIPSSRPILVSLARWSQQHRSQLASPGRLVWLFQLDRVPCFEVGFVPPGEQPRPPDRAGCDEYHLFDAQSGAEIGGGFTTMAGATVLRPP